MKRGRMTVALILAWGTLAWGTLAWGTLAWSAPPSDPVRRLERALAATHDLDARFVQTRHSPLLPGEERSSGTLAIKKPGFARLEYREPSPLIVWKREDSTWVYTPSNAQVIVSPAGAAGVPVSWVLGASLADIQKTADVHAAGAEVEILPHADAGLPWSSVRVAFGSDGFPNRYDFTDESGEQVRIQLSSVRRNRGLSDQRFRPSYPSGTRVVDTGS